MSFIRQIYLIASQSPLTRFIAKDEGVSAGSGVAVGVSGFGKAPGGGPVGVSVGKGEGVGRGVGV
jgi:hypothetical protein